MGHLISVLQTRVWFISAKKQVIPRSGRTIKFTKQRASKFAIKLHNYSSLLLSNSAPLRRRHTATATDQIISLIANTKYS
jgi:hypothetical protein